MKLRSLFLTDAMEATVAPLPLDPPPPPGCGTPEGGNRANGVDAAASANTMAVVEAAVVGSSIIPSNNVTRSK